MLSFLPEFILKSIKQFDISKICEIRLRQNAPIFIFIDKKWINIQLQNGEKVSAQVLENIVLRLCNHSVYAHIDTIKQGYLSTKNGVRVGIAGKVVKENEQVKIIKDVTSLCIRIPHEIHGFGQVVYDNVFKTELQNLLIISPPGYGKTTLLRNIIRLLSDNYNVLCVDEKMEIFAENKFFLGDRTDVLQYSSKSYGFNYGVKTMSPDVICVDELSTENDVSECINACFSGVKVVATVHGKSVEDIRKKSVFGNLITSGAFDAYCLLERRGEITKIGKL